MIGEMTQKKPTHNELLKAVAAYLGEELASASPLGATLKFAYTEGGCIAIDGTGPQVRVVAEDVPADCTITLSLDTHIEMLRFELDQGHAFQQGKMRISGDIGAALRLAPRISKPFQPPFAGDVG